jgi:hypothetical protein
VFEQEGIGDTGLFESIRKNGERCQVEGFVWERTLFVGGLGEPDDRAVVPSEQGRGKSRSLARRRPVSTYHRSLG